LLELLVVVAILAVVATMLLAALSRAKVSTDSVGCKSNLRQLSMGLNLYVQEEGVYPPFFDGGAMGGVFPSNLPRVPYNYERLADGTVSYLGPVNSIWVCPWYNRVRGWVAPANGSYGYNMVGATDADLQGLGLSGRWTNGVWAPTRESQVVNPSEMIAVCDAVLKTDSIRGGGELPLTGWPSLTGFGDLTSIVLESIIPGLPANDPAVQAMKQRHATRWNVCFCDGHIECLRPIGLFDMDNPDQRRRWNNDHHPHSEAR
jgi:prepilin-type processing-associated H-X9-DG protein